MNNNQENNNGFSPMNYGSYPQGNANAGNANVGIGSMLQSPDNNTNNVANTIPVVPPVPTTIPEPVLGTPIANAHEPVQSNVETSVNPVNTNVQPVIMANQGQNIPVSQNNAEPQGMVQQPNTFQSQNMTQLPNMAQPQGMVQQPNVGGTIPGNDNQPSDDNNANGKPPIVMIIITVLVVLGVGTFLFLYLTGKINFGKTETNNQDDVVEEIDTTNELVEWMDYVLNQNITEIKLNRTTEDGSNTAEELTVDDLREIFLNLTNNELNEEYIKNTEFTYDNTLTINYQKNDSAYVIYIGDDRLFFDEEYNLVPSDDELLVYLETLATAAEADNSDDELLKSFVFETFDSSIYNKYFETVLDNEE